MELVDNLPGEHVFEAGTLEGLMKLMGENNETAIGSYDEFATFIDSLDKGTHQSPVLFHVETFTCFHALCDDYSFVLRCRV